MFDLIAAFSCALARQPNCTQDCGTINCALTPALRRSLPPYESLQPRDDKVGNLAPFFDKLGASGSRQHLVSPRLARPSPASREGKAARTLLPKGGASGADFRRLSASHACFLSTVTNSLRRLHFLELNRDSIVWQSLCYLDKEVCVYLLLPSPKIAYDGDGMDDEQQVNSMYYQPRVFHSLDVSDGDIPILC